MKTASTVVVSLLAALPYVAAHGYVPDISIDGKNFKGNTPKANPGPSVIRLVDDIVPVKGAMNPDVNCGTRAQKATLVADANPGSVVSFDWRGGDGVAKWPHNIGPMFTYMASCGDTTCDQFDSQKAKWFKIQEVGKKPDGSAWFQQDLKDGGVANVTIPKNIAPGQYLIRHEIIALHIGNQPGGAEWYPSCAQIKVGGNGTGKPKDSELVSLPGAYKDSDAGILVPNVFNADLKYTFPGPAVASFVSGGVSGNGSSTSSSSAPKPTKSSGSCKLKTKNGAVAQPSPAAQSSYQPRRISRVMRNFRMH